VKTVAHANLCPLPRAICLNVNELLQRQERACIDVL